MVHRLLAQQKPNRRYSCNKGKNRVFFKSLFLSFFRLLQSLIRILFSPLYLLFSYTAPVVRRFLLKYVLTVRTMSVILILLSVSAAFFLVFSSIRSPELPETSIRSIISNSGGTETDQADFLRVTIKPEDDPVVSYDMLGYSQSGSGSNELDRTEDIEYIVRPGETLSEIARSFGIRWAVLGHYNKIPDVSRIQAGISLKIPSLENEKKATAEIASMPVRGSRQAVRRTLSVKIAYDTDYVPGTYTYGLRAKFKVVDPSHEKFTAFDWEFGDGNRSGYASPVYTFYQPRTYSVRLTARDSKGNVYKSNPLFIDIPHPDSIPTENNNHYLTFSSMNEFFVTPGVITKVRRFSDVSSAPLDFFESDEHLTKVRFTKPGYFGLDVLRPDGENETYSVFVSPVPSKHVDLLDESLNWYRTQFNTGTASNCGPATISMAIGWATDKYVPVSSIRQAVGWTGNGGTSMEQLLSVLKEEGAPSAYIKSLRSIRDLHDVIDSNSIAIILFHTGGLEMAASNASDHMFDRYYTDEVGHYLTIKGYSLDGKYLIAYDPVPSDWSTNSFRYADGLSMIGRNRYYDAKNIIHSLRRYDMIVVPREPQ